MRPIDIVLILGTRPQIIKSALFIDLANEDDEIRLNIIHTGQHYDYEMTKIFFEELSLPDPTADLKVGSGGHAFQTANMMMRLEKALSKQRPDLVVVPGDTNSTLAGALVAAKLQIPVAHIEAGARSYDMSMPEEINRRLTDHCSTLLFTPTENCTKNLRKEGINRIHQTGDTMYDVLLQQMSRAEKNQICQQLGLQPRTYILLTTHRPENVDNPQNLKNLVYAIAELKTIMTVFPAHPRTRKQLRKFRLYDKLQKQTHVKLIKPVSYHETLKLVKNAKLTITDSGGMQKEAFWLGTPCITLRENTEWIETVQLKANHLVGTNKERILETAQAILAEEEEVRSRMRSLQNPFGDGKASQKAIEAIKTYWSKSV